MTKSWWVLVGQKPSGGQIIHLFDRKVTEDYLVDAQIRYMKKYRQVDYLDPLEFGDCDIASYFKFLIDLQNQGVIIDV